MLLQGSLSLQGYPSSEGLCTPRGISDTPRSCYQDGADAADSDPNETVHFQTHGTKALSERIYTATQSAYSHNVSRPPKV